MSCPGLGRITPRPASQKAERVRSIGQWRKCLGKGRRRAHNNSGIVMDIAAFKVSHSVGLDATALRAARARSSSIGAMERYRWVRFVGKLTPCHTHTHGNSQHTSGAMDESSGKVQRCKHTSVAVLSWILQSSKLATPLDQTATPPPCEPREQGQAP